MSDTKEFLTDNRDKADSDKCLVMLFAPPALEESIVDWLLESSEISGFSTTESYGHGQRSSALSLLEQVTGRQRRIQFIVETDQKVATGLLNALGLNFVGLHFMVVPLLSVGRL
jgi:hypothetical protein